MFILSLFIILLSTNINIKAELTSLESANNLAELGIIVNKSDNTSEYRLDSTITRREMLKIMMKLSGKTVDQTCTSKFTDLNSQDWGCKYAETALSLGYIAPNKTFRPDDQVSKIEALKMIFKAKGIQREENSDWRAGYVNTATSLGIVNNFNNYDTASDRGWIFVGADNVIKKDDKIIEQPKICTMEYTPVCGIDGKTYSNKCMAGDINILHNGECSNDDLINQIKPSIEIAFAGDMDKLSVERNFKIYPEVKTNLVWEDNKTLKIEVTDEIEEETDFIVNVLDDALTINGEKLEDTIIKKFKTSGVAKIDFISPDGAITDLTKNITVRFSKPIISLTTLDNQPICPINIVPNLPGKCVWITTSTFQFRPDQGFPIGASYNVTIPKGIKTIAGDTTINTESVKITTPKFEIINTPNSINKDSELNISFNDDVSLDNFKSNFEINGFNLNELNIKYYEHKVSEHITETKKNIISIFPKYLDWGYDNIYSYKLKNGLKSIRGNITIGYDRTKTLTRGKLLTSYNPFIYINNELEDKTLNTNLKNSQNKTIITRENPNIILNFYEEVKLDKSLFSIITEKQIGNTINNEINDFNIKYAKQSNYVDGENIVTENKKSIILEIIREDISPLKLKIKASKISSKSQDIDLTFYTKNLNKIENFKLINYKKSCLTTLNEIDTYGKNTSYFDFGDESKVTYISEVSKWNTNEKDCPYIAGINTYILNTRLNPDQNYNLIIKKELLDRDNYKLLQDYDYTFLTNKALNEDKSVNIVDSRDIILVPTDITPLGVAIKTINLDKIEVKVCEGDFNIENINYIENEDCKTKDIKINNLGFKTNFSVINLEQIFDTTFNKSLVTLKVSKLQEDKTEYEIKNEQSTYYKERKVHFVRTNKSVVLKGNGEKNILWLSDFRTGELLSNKITKVDRYTRESSYSPLGKYQGMIAKLFSSMNFESIGNGLYELDGIPSGYILITLDDGEQIFLDANYMNFSHPNTKTYITTDRAIYKPGNKVNIKGIIRKQNAENYEIIRNKLNIVIRDSRYKELINENISVSENGTFNFEYTLDPEASLGNYNISIKNSLLNSYSNIGGSLSFAVEEFEKPDFKIESKSEKDFYLYSEVPKIDIQSDYYVGVPLSNGKGTYSVNASDYHFNGGKTSGYNWGENNTFYWWGYTKNSNSNNIEYNKKFILDNKGSSTQSIETSKTTKDKIYNISTTITDPNTSKSLSSSTSFKLLNSDIFVGMKFNKYYYDFGDTAKLDFITVDTEGDKVGNKDINFKVYKIEYNYDENTYKTTKEEKLLEEKSLTTSTNGIENIEYNLNDSGEYRFEIELENGKYKTTKTIYVSGFNLVKPSESEHDLTILKNKEIYDIGDNAEFIIQSEVIGVKALVTVEKLDKILYKKVIDIESNSQKLTLPIKREYLPNFELKVFIIKSVDNFKSSLEELKALRIEMKEIEDKIYSKEENTIIPYYICYDIVNKGGIKPQSNYTGVDKIYLNLLSKDRAQEQVLMQKIIPGYFSGKSDVKINLNSIKIDSKVTLDKDSYLPSDSQKITLELKDNNGNPINGEAVISIVDEALLALKNNDKDIVNFFYSSTSNMIKTKFNLDKLIKRFEFGNEDIEKPEMQKRLSGGINFGMEKSAGLVGSNAMDFDDSDMMLDSMVMSESIEEESMTSSTNNGGNATKLRTDFKDSAYYKAVINVIDGKAIIEVPKLPDNLTTWVIKGYTITKDTKVGNFETKFKVQKELNLLPSIPRFFVVGDKTEVSGVLINNSDNALDINVNIDTDNLEVLNNNKTISVPANSQLPFNFEVKVKNKDPEISWEEYNTDITLTAKAGDLVDSVKINKDIIPYSTPEYTFTNGSTYDLSYEEKINLPNYVDKDLGELDISIGSSILTNLLDSIHKLARMPMNNFYSTVSALNKASVLKGLYSKTGEIELYNNITVTDYLGFEHKLDSIVKSRIKDFEDYQNSDGGMMYYNDCIPNSWRKTCSNFNLTGEFLNTAKKLQDNGYNIDQNIVNKAISYYKNELETIIKNYELQGYTYSDIEPFYTILGYDNEFIKKYILSPRYTSKIDTSNIFKLKLILILQTIDPNNTLINNYLKELKNSTIIEARGSLIPASSGYGNNSLSTSLGLKVFINNLEGEKLIIENFARWLISQKNENGNFGNSFDTSEVIEAITNYITYTKELDNVNFEAKGFLNNKEVISKIFNSNNKFELSSKSYKLKDYINLGVDNSLGFEKTGTGKLYYDIGLRYYLPIDKIEARDEGIIVNRNYYNYDEYKDAFKKECYYPYWESNYHRSYYPCKTKKVKNIENINSGNKGDYLVGEIELIIPHERNNILINNYIPSGAEIVNVNLDTTSNEIKNVTSQINSSYWRGFDHIENKTDRMILYADRLYKGTYKYTYVLKLNHKGTFHHRPAVAEVMKKPEVWGRSKGEFFEIK